MKTGKMNVGFVVLLVSMLLFVGNMSAELLVYEGFDYVAGSNLNGQGTATDGWTEAWSTTKTSALIAENSLTMPNLLYTPTGGSLTGYDQAAGRHIEGLPFYEDGVYYMSFMMQHTGAWSTDDNTGEWLYVRMQTNAGNNMATCGITSTEQIWTTDLGSSQYLEGAGATSEVLFMVAKIVTSTTANDEIFLKVYTGSDTIDAVETTSWTLSGGNENEGRTCERIYLDFGYESGISFNFDELRIGTTWEDVVVPEPATMVLLLTGGLFAIKQKRR